MGKNKLSSGLINVVTYDTDSNISLNSGSNLLMSLSGSGTVTIPGNLVVLGGISGSTAESASYSLNADKIDNLDSTQLVLTSSFNSYTSSASSSLGSLSGSVATTTSGLGGRITTIEGNYATTGSNTFNGTQTITGSICTNGNIITTGQIVAQTINVQQVTSSIIYSCGSNVFGTDINNTQTFTGSMFITGSNIRANVGNTCFGGTICTTEVGFTSNVNSSISEEYGIKLNLGGATSQYGAQFYNCSGTKVAQISATGVACLLGLQVYSTNSDPNMEFYRTTCNAGVGIGRLYWNGNDNVGTKTLYSYIQGVIEACGTTSYCSRFEVYTACNGALSRNFQLNGVGVACFANTVCTTNIISTGASGGRYGTFNAPTNGGYVTFEAGGTAFGDIGSYCAQYGTGDATTLLLGSRTGYALALGTNSSERVRITSDGYVAITGNQGLKCVPYLQGMSFGWNRTNGQGESMINWTNAGGGTSCDLTFNFRDSSTLYERLRISSLGVATFSNNITINRGDGNPATLQLGNTQNAFQIQFTCTGGQRIAFVNGAPSEFASFYGTGVSCFSGTVCSPYLSTRTIEMGGSATSPSTACVGYGMFGYSGVGLGISAAASGPNQGMGFFTCGDFERMRLTTSGNLGIGCTTPAYLLDVNGRTRLCGNVGIRVAPSSAGDQYLTTGDAGIAYSNSYFGTGQVRIGGGSDHVSNTVLSVAPGVVTFDRPGVGGGALKIDGSGNVSVNNTTATAKFHAYGTTKLENYTYYGYAQSFVWQSSFNNPVQSLFTFNASAPYSQTLIKVTFIQNGVSNGYAARYVGFALAHLNPYSFNSSVTSMTAEYTNGPAAPTLSWSGQTLQITPQRVTNYDGYVVFIEWGSNTNTNTVPTVTL